MVERGRAGERRKVESEAVPKTLLLLYYIPLAAQAVASSVTLRMGRRAQKGREN